MTDKYLIKQEIERQIDYVENDTRYTESYREGLIAAYQTIKAFIDSLPEEHASDGLEEAALKYRWEHPFCDGYTAYSFKAGAEWQKQAMKDFMGKACEWLSKNARNYYSAYATSDKLIEQFKNYMQDEM